MALKKRRRKGVRTGYSGKRRRSYNRNKRKQNKKLRHWGRLLFAPFVAVLISLLVSDGKITSDDIKQYATPVVFFVISEAREVLPPAVVSSIEGHPIEKAEPATIPDQLDSAFILSDVPAYTDAPYYVVNDNVPYFTTSDLTTEPFEYYSDLDRLGRCGIAYANICRELMPTEERGPIGMVRPSGWHLAKYDIVDGKFLYNRCHLIGFQLAGENANIKNLITGTRYLNVVGMLPFENEVADYVRKTGNHVLYRVTPVFENDNLVASGVLMEALSVEDNGTGVSFCVYCYNAQPGVTIDYATGDSVLAVCTTTPVLYLPVQGTYHLPV